MNEIVAYGGHSLEWYSHVPRSIKRQTVLGLLLLSVSFGGFGYWGATAPLAAAVIAQGSFVATGQNKIVQHLEGGIIHEILVSEGDDVHAGQPIMKLDETAALANERQFFLRRARLEAINARLTAEFESNDEFEIPEYLLSSLTDPEIASILDSQKLNFVSARRKLESDIQLLRSNIDSLRFRAEGYEGQKESMQQQLGYLEDEFTGKKALLAQGLIRATEVNAMKRAMADANGQIQRLASEVSETNAQVRKHEEQIAQTRAAYQEAVVEEMQSIQAELDGVREQSRNAENVLRRSVIEAPVAGTIIRLHYHSSGGVVESGKSIAEILPTDVPLIIEVQVPRTDIDTVKSGQDATVRLTALNQRTTPVLDGKVYYVSADSIPEGNSGQVREVYLARVSLDSSQLRRVPGFTPTPGMPVEIMIQTQERTFFDYLSRPIADSMARAFREQ